MRAVAIVALLLVGCEDKPECVRGHWTTRHEPARCSCVCYQARPAVWMPRGELIPARDVSEYVCDERASDRPSMGGKIGPVQP